MGTEYFPNERYPIQIMKTMLDGYRISTCWTARLMPRNTFETMVFERNGDEIGYLTQHDDNMYYAQISHEQSIRSIESRLNSVKEKMEKEYGRLLL